MLACVRFFSSSGMAYSFQVMCVPYEETTEGFEMQIGVGTALYTSFVGPIAKRS